MRLAESWTTLKDSAFSFMLLASPSLASILDAWRTALTGALAPEPEHELVRSGLAQMRFMPAAGPHDGATAVSLGGMRWRPFTGQLKPGAAVALVLPEDTFFKRTVRLPRGATRHLAQVLELDLSQILPVARETIVVASRLLQHEGRTDDCDAEAEQVVVRRDIISAAADSAAAAGFRAAAVALADGGGILPYAFDLSGEPFSSRRFAGWQKAAAASILCVVLAAASTMSAISWMSSSLQGDMAAEQAALEVKAKTVRAHFAQQRERAELRTAILQLQRSNAAMLSAIEDLTRILPDSASLQSLMMSGEDIVFEGQAAAPESLISVIEASDSFADASFSAPIYRGPGEASARFSIKARLNGVVPAATVTP